MDVVCVPFAQRRSSAGAIFVTAQRILSGCLRLIGAKVFYRVWKSEVWLAMTYVTREIIGSNVDRLDPWSAREPQPEPMISLATTSAAV